MEVSVVYPRDDRAIICQSTRLELFERVGFLLWRGYKLRIVHRIVVLNKNVRTSFRNHPVVSLKAVGTVKLH